MNKRDFLKSTVGILLLPSVSLAAPKEDLLGWFEKNFDCKVGLQAPWVSERFKDDYQYVYKTFRAGVLDSTESVALATLTEYFIKQFEPVASGRPILWWRTKPELFEDQVVDWGETWMAAEDVEDATESAYSKHQRLLAEKLKTKPDNVEMDFETGAYRYVLSKHTLHRMRFRLAIPSKHKELAAFSVQEGSLAPRIA